MINFEEQIRQLQRGERQIAFLGLVGEIESCPLENAQRAELMDRFFPEVANGNLTPKELQRLTKTVMRSKERG